MGLHTLSVDGIDLGAVWAASRDARERAISGHGASFIEMRTVTWPGGQWPTLATGITEIRHAWTGEIPAEFMHLEAWFRRNDPVLSDGKVRVPVMFHAVGGIRISGAAQHSARPQAMLMQAAGLQIIAPAVASDVKGLLQAARDSERPTFWIDHALLFEESWPDDDVKSLPLGKAAIIRTGKDVTLVGYSIDLVRCVKAAKVLAGEGVDAEVIDLRSLAPLDRESILESVGKTGRLVIADECYPAASVGSEVASIFVDEGFGLLKKPVRRVNFPAVPVPASPPLEAFLMPTVDKIVAAAKDLVA